MRAAGISAYAGLDGKRDDCSQRKERTKMEPCRVCGDARKTTARIKRYGSVYCENVRACLARKIKAARTKDEVLTITYEEAQP